MSTETEVPTRVVTPKAILSYPHLDKPQAGSNGQPGKYSATFVFAEGTDLSALEAAALAVAEERWGKKAKDMLKKGSLRSPFRKDAEAKGYEAGSIFINTRSGQKPGTVYLWPDPETGKAAKVPEDKIKETFYPGAIVRGHIAAFAYDKDGNKGVSFALNHVQFMANGERIDSRVAADDAFDVDMSATPDELNDLL